jgi:hypothetical protein
MPSKGDGAGSGAVIRSVLRWGDGLVMRTLLKTLSHAVASTEAWVIFFLMGIIMMNYPFITIFDKDMTIGGYPLLFLYLVGGWFVSICVIYLFVRSASNTSSPSHTSCQEKQ